jgi:hypothetical protein
MLNELRKGGLQIIDRQQLLALEKEYGIQENPDVEASADTWRGHQQAPQFIIEGALNERGNSGTSYQVELVAINVGSRETIPVDPVIIRDTKNSDFLPVKKDLDVIVHRAVKNMGKNLPRKAQFRIGRIAWRNTDFVTTLSAYLAADIEHNVTQYPTKFEVTTDEKIDAVLSGSYTPIGEDVEVTINIASAGKRLGSSKFTVPKKEITDRELEINPPKGDSEISDDELDEMNEMVTPYNEENNKFGLTITLNHPDGRYYDQELLSFKLYAEKDCYFKVTHVDKNGDPTVIYPAKPRDNNFIKGGTTRTIPDNSQYRMRKPFGLEQILVAAYEEEFTSQSEQEARISKALIARGLAVKGMDNEDLEPAATVKVSYTIMPKK